MSALRNGVLALCIGAIGIQCSDNPAGSPGSPPYDTDRELSPAEKRLIESDNSFGLTLFKQIVDGERDRNVFISPLSVSMALGMTYNGADGATQEEMEAVLGLAGLSRQEINASYESLIALLSALDPKVRFLLANSIWYRQGFPVEADFIDLNQTYFGATVRGLDFDDPQTVDTINAWVDENTQGKIEEIVEAPISPATMMFLINAIYSHGTWTYRFDESDTRDAQFNLPDGSQTACKMMRQSGDFQYFSGADFQAVDLPYGDGDYSMAIILPHPGRDIDAIIGELDAETWEDWMGRFAPFELDPLELPRFTLEYEIGLNDVLKALGMESAFSPSQANFTGMYDETGMPNLYISKVKHKTFVKVNEEGTEAAAVTSVEMALESMPPSMRVDRPFIFAIRENRTGTILFVGKIVEPTWD